MCVMINDPARAGTFIMIRIKVFVSVVTTVLSCGLAFSQSADVDGYVTEEKAIQEACPARVSFGYQIPAGHRYADMRADSTRMTRCTSVAEGKAVVAEEKALHEACPQRVAFGYNIPAGHRYADMRADSTRMTRCTSIAEGKAVVAEEKALHEACPARVSFGYQIPAGHRYADMRAGSTRITRCTSAAEGKAVKSYVLPGNTAGTMPNMAIGGVTTSQVLPQNDPLFGSAQGERARYDQELAQAEVDIKAMKDARAKGNVPQAVASRKSAQEHLARANGILESRQGREDAKGGVTNATYYGNYCGKGWTSNGNGNGINLIDDACKAHDSQYDSVEQTRKEADALEAKARDFEIAKGLRSPTANSTPPVSPNLIPHAKQIFEEANRLRKEAGGLRKDADAKEKQADMKLVEDMRIITTVSLSKDIVSGKGGRRSFYGDIEKDKKFADCTATYFDKKVKSGEVIAEGWALACAPVEIAKEGNPWR